MCRGRQECRCLYRLIVEWCLETTPTSIHGFYPHSFRGRKASLRSHGGVSSGRKLNRSSPASGECISSPLATGLFNSISSSTYKNHHCHQSWKKLAGALTKVISRWWKGRTPPSLSQGAKVKWKNDFPFEMQSAQPRTHKAPVFPLGWAQPWELSKSRQLLREELLVGNDWGNVHVSVAVKGMMIPYVWKVGLVCRFVLSIWYKPRHTWEEAFPVEGLPHQIGPWCFLDC